MKKIFLLFVTIIGCWQVNAQPVIGTQFFPRIGHNQERVEVFHFSISPGNIGPGQTWDFSLLQAPPGALRTTYEHHSPGLTPYGEDFQQANVAAIITDTIEIFAYYSIHPNGWDWLGVGTEFGPQVFDDPLSILRPMAMDDFFRDTASLSYVFEGFEYYQYIEEEVWYRASGTLKLPQGTFHDVVLVQTNQIEIDSFLFGDEGFYSIDTIYTQVYNWMLAGAPGPLGTYSISEGVSKLVFEGEDPIITIFDPEVEAQFDLNLPTATDEPERSIEDLSIAPNPASGIAWLNLTAREQVSNASMKVLDATGRTLRNESIDIQEGTNRYPLNIDGMPGGLYWVTVTSREQTQTSRLIVKG